MAPHTYHAHKVASKEKGERWGINGHVILGSAKVPFRFVLAYLKVKNTIVAPQ